MVKSTDKRSGPGRHGAHKALTEFREGKAINKRTKLGRYLKKTRQDLINDLRGNLNPAQEILLDRIMEKLMFLSLIGDYVKQHGTDIVKDGKIIPCLGENYIAYDNALPRNIKAFYELEVRNKDTKHDAEQDAYLQAVMGKGRNKFRENS